MTDKTILLKPYLDWGFTGDKFRRDILVPALVSNCFDMVWVDLTGCRLGTMFLHDAFVKLYADDIIDDKSVIFNKLRITGLGSGRVITRLGVAERYYYKRWLNGLSGRIEDLTELINDNLFAIRSLQKALYDFKIQAMIGSFDN